MEHEIKPLLYLLNYYRRRALKTQLQEHHSHINTYKDSKRNQLTNIPPHCKEIFVVQISYMINPGTIKVAD